MAVSLPRRGTHDERNDRHLPGVAVTRFVAALVAALTFAPVSSIADAAPVPVTVEFQSFAPTTLDVLPGDAVTWMNMRRGPHPGTADGGQFDSGDLLDGGVFSQVFSTLGSYPYHCNVHPGMVGEGGVSGSHD